MLCSWHPSDVASRVPASAVNKKHIEGLALLYAMGQPLTYIQIEGVKQVSTTPLWM